jgi:hypothetical protein
MSKKRSPRLFKPPEILRQEEELGKTIWPHRIVFDDTDGTLHEATDDMINKRAHYELDSPQTRITVVRFDREIRPRYVGSIVLRTSIVILVWYVKND